MTNKKRRLVAIILAAAVLFVMLFSAVFIAEEAGHDCIGENCPVCCQINACRNVLENLSLAVCVFTFIAAVKFTLQKVVSSLRENIQNQTPVNLKVKLSD